MNQVIAIASQPPKERTATIGKTEPEKFEQLLKFAKPVHKAAILAALDIDSLRAFFGVMKPEEREALVTMLVTVSLHFSCHYASSCHSSNEALVFLETELSREREKAVRKRE